MAQIGWTVQQSGDWTNAADWGGTVPGAADDVTIGVFGITVTVSTGAQAANSITTTLSTLAVTGGTLSIGSYANFYGGYAQSGGSLLLAGRGAIFYGAASLSSGTINSQASELTSNGGFTQSGGTMILSGQGGVFNGSLAQTGGTIRIASGALDLYGTNTSLAGTVSGAGSLVVAGNYNGLNGTTTLSSGLVLSVQKVFATSGTLAFAQAGSPYTFTYGGYFSATGQTIVALNGNTLALKGRAQFGADFNGGTITATGHGQLNGLILDNSAVLTLGASYNQTGAVTLRASSKIAITAAGALRITGNDTISDVSSNGSLTDAGLLAKTAGVGTAEILTSFTSSAGATVTVASGTLDFSGVTNSFGGSIGGAGTLSLGGVNTGVPSSDTFASALTLATGGFAFVGPVSTTLNIDSSFSYAGSWDQSGGLLQLGNTGSALTLTLSGSTILDGGVIKSSFGTIDTKGLVDLGNSPSYQSGIDIEGFTSFIVESQAFQTASIQLGAQSGSRPVATIMAGASWFLEGSASVTGAYGAIVNNGTLAKLNGASAGSIDGTLTNMNKGLIQIDSSSLVLDGSGSLDGTITGPGRLVLEGSGTYALASTLSLSTGAVLIDNTPQGQQSSVVSLQGNLAYAGVWGQHGGSLQLDGDTLALTGTAVLDGGTIGGPGTLTTAGATTLGGEGGALNVTGSAVLTITGAAEQATDITVGNSAVLLIAAGATFTQDDSVNIFGTGTLSVAGTFTDHATGLGSITASVVDTGSIKLASGELSFLGGVSGGGAFAVGSGAHLDLYGPVASGITVGMAAGNASLLLGDASAFGGVIGGFVSGDFIEITALSSGVITDSLDPTGKKLTISDSSQHTFTLDFSQAQTLTSIEIAAGPHGYIGIYHI